MRLAAINGVYLFMIVGFGFLVLLACVSVWSSNYCLVFVLLSIVDTRHTVQALNERGLMMD